MSILIKGAKMPTNCKNCDLYRHCDVPFNDEYFKRDSGKPSDCPLVDIPPHGRLIDADKLKNDIPETDADCFENCRDCTLLHQEDVWDIIDDAATVIESEVEE